MTYDSPFWTIEGEVILEVANFKEEGLVTLEGWEGEKENLKIYWSMQGIEPWSPGWIDSCNSSLVQLYHVTYLSRGTIP